MIFNEFKKVLISLKYFKFPKGMIYIKGANKGKLSIQRAVGGGTKKRSAILLGIIAISLGIYLKSLIIERSLY